MDLAIITIYLLSILSALLTGKTTAAGNAVLEGVQEALLFAPKLCAALCLWSAVTELLEHGGAANALARLLRRPLSLLFPIGAGDGETLAALTENAGANLLGPASGRRRGLYISGRAGSSIPSWCSTPRPSSFCPRRRRPFARPWAASHPLTSQLPSGSPVLFRFWWDSQLSGF